MRLQRVLLALGLAWGSIAWAQSNPTCGNGTVDGGEACDDGNTVSGDGCRGNCFREFCGDKVVNNKTEECDDGNNIEDDGCSGTCVKSEVSSPEASDESASKEVTITPQEGFQRATVTTLFLFPPISLIYGPSVGHIAAGESGRAFGMSFTRGLVLGSAVLTARALAAGKIGQQGGRLLLGVEGALLSVLVAVDLLDASRAVERALANKK